MATRIEFPIIAQTMNINGAAHWLVDQANVRRETLESEFNGYVCVASPGSRAQGIVDAYWLASRQRELKRHAVDEAKRKIVEAAEACSAMELATLPAGLRAAVQKLLELQA